ncbi:MAG: hypothetical protein Q9187_009043, partial [Circinaria calcarea]
DDAALKRFQDKLKEMAKLDGCGVEYVTLTGPDLLPDRHCGNRAKFSFGCNERIVCDLRRGCKLVSHGVLKQLKGFALWKKVGTVGRAKDGIVEVRTREELELPFETAGNRELVGRDLDLAEHEAALLSIHYDTYRLHDPTAKLRFVLCPPDKPRSCEDCIRNSTQPVSKHDFNSLST